jgi:hypothetical protein
MDCGRFEKLIDSYLDSRLAGTLLAEFHAHRLNCRRCSRVVSMLQAAGDVIAQDHCEPKISADFADRVLAAMPVAQKVNRSVWIVRLGASAAGLAAAAAIIFAVMLGGQVGHERKTDVAGVQAWMEGADVKVPQNAEVVHHEMVLPDGQPVTGTSKAETAPGGTLLDGQFVRDAVHQVFRWDEVKLKGE